MRVRVRGEDKEEKEVDSGAKLNLAAAAAGSLFFTSLNLPAALVIQ